MQRLLGVISAFGAVWRCGALKPGPTCDLTYMSEKLHLITMARTRDDVLMEHFLKHYSRLGVNLQTGARIILHVQDEASHDKMMKVLSSFNIRDVETTREYNSNVKRTLVNRWLRELPLQAWAIYADTDEFFEFPCAIRQLIEKNKQNEFWGRMIDHLGPDYTFPDLKASPNIQQQYPVSCPCLRSSMGAEDHKYMLFQVSVNGKVRQFVNSHSFVQDNINKVSLSAKLRGAAPLSFMHEVMDTTRFEYLGNPTDEMHEIYGFPHYEHTGRTFSEKLLYKIQAYTTGATSTNRGDVVRANFYDKYLKMLSWSGAMPAADEAPVLTEFGRTFLSSTCKVSSDNCARPRLEMPRSRRRRRSQLKAM